MFSVKIEADYHNNFKADMLYYLRGEISKNNLTKDFIDLFEKISEVEEKVSELNKSYLDLEKKYVLLFRVRDFRQLFQDASFRQEMFNYIKYKGEISEETNEVLSA